MRTALGSAMPTPTLAALDLVCYCAAWYVPLAGALYTLCLTYYVGSERFAVDCEDTGNASSALTRAVPPQGSHACPVATTEPAADSVQTVSPCGPRDHATRRVGHARNHAVNRGYGPVMVCRVRHVGAAVKPTPDIGARPVCHTIAHDWTRAHGMAHALGARYVND